MKEFTLKKFNHSELANHAKYSLSVSYAEGWTFSEILSLAGLNNFDLGNLSFEYPSIHGNPILKEKVSLLLGEIPSDNIIITNGADEAIQILISVLSEKVNQAIIQTPAYPPFKAHTELNSFKTLEWKLKPEAKWSAYVSELPSLINDVPSLLLLSIPNNPTGWVPTEDELVEIAACVRRTNSVLIIDEVYAGLEEGKPPFLKSSNLNCNCIRVGSLSKSFGMPGLRMGWIAMQQPSLVPDIINFRDYLNSYVSQPVEHISSIVLENYKAILYRNLKITQGNRKLLQSFFSKHLEKFGMTTIPDAGPVAFIKWKGQESTQELTKRLLHEYKILLVNGFIMDSLPDYLRIGFGTKSFEESLSAFENALI